MGKYMGNDCKLNAHTYYFLYTAKYFPFQYELINC